MGSMNRKKIMDLVIVWLIVMLALIVASILFHGIYLIYLSIMPIPTAWIVGFLFLHVVVVFLLYVWGEFNNGGDLDEN